MINRELWNEACEMLNLTETEKKLAEKLMDGPMGIHPVFAEYFNNEVFQLSPVFGHSGEQVFLYPEFVCFVNGEIPDSENGSLPKGMTLEFPEKQECYGGEGLVKEISQLYQLQATDDTGHCILLSGKEGSGFLVRQAAWQMGRPVLFWDGKTAADNEILLIAILYDAFVCLDLRMNPEEAEKKMQPGFHLCRQGIDLVILSDDTVHAMDGRFSFPVLSRIVQVPDEKIRSRYINDSLKISGLKLHSGQRNRLAEEPFSIPTLKRILGELKLEAELKRSSGLGNDHHLEESVFASVFARYKKDASENQGIRRMAANRSLTDLCLPEEQHRKLENICDMLKNRDKVMHQWGFLQKYSYGNGISILLYGAPGTGKTMAAQVIANELAMPLYRVDLSALISKYIGETQKNIAKIFDQAKQMNGILLFDEADALFARRNEVSDAQDKYANAETAYLLQRIEESEGICILTTNLLQNFDEAFRRRITYMIHFPMPDETLREQIWRNVFPKEAPLDTGIDFQLLAENFELSGAAIRNAAVQSAWNASVECDCIRMQDILHAVENEYRKLNKAMKPAQKALIELFD